MWWTFVYFVQAGEAGPVKIGRSRKGGSVEHRIRGFQIAHYETLHIVAVLRGNYGSERFLHEKFAEYRLRGEWFEVRGRLQRYLASIAGRREDIRKERSRQVCSFCERRIRSPRLDDTEQGALDFDPDPQPDQAIRLVR